MGPMMHSTEDLALVQSDAKTTIQNMVQKGATEKDCQNLAEKTCKEVEVEVRTDQALVNRQKTGRHCMSLGVKAERRAHLHWRRTRTTHHNMRRKVTIAYHKRVTISSQTYSSLRHGKCGFVFNSRSYRTTRATYIRAKRIEMTWRGRVSEAWKAYLRMKSIRIRQQHRCHCSTKAALERVWRIVTDKKRKARQAKAYAKCKMMQCVLKGTKLTSGVCKGVLKIVRKKTLYHVTRRTNCSRHAYKRGGPKPVVYQHCNFGGYKKVLHHSTDWVRKLGIRNDDLSSIKVPKGKCVTLYEHHKFRGKHWKICGPRNVKCFVHHRNGGIRGNWNDKVSSIKVTSVNHRVYHERKSKVIRERKGKHDERTQKARVRERRAKESKAKERQNKERSKKREVKAKERHAKAVKRERAAKAQERRSKELRHKERTSKHRERVNKQAVRKRSFRCGTRVVTSNHAGVIRVAPHRGYTMTGGGMINNYRHWNARAGFEEMMPEGGNYRCDMGFGAGRLNCYSQSCTMHGGITCRTWSRRLRRSGVMTVSVGAGYTLTGGGIYNHYRHFNARSGFEESFPQGNAWRGDMGFGWGDFTVYARGCKASYGRLHCITRTGPANRNWSQTASCPSGYQLTGCGINNHYRHFNKLSGFEATHPSGNKCTCDSGFGHGKNTCYARCCKAAAVVKKK